LDVFGCAQMYSDILECSWMYLIVLRHNLMYSDIFGCPRTYLDVLEHPYVMRWLHLLQGLCPISSLYQPID
jgi:hypothetical protein